MVVNVRCAAYILGVVIAIQFGNVVGLWCFCRDPSKGCESPRDSILCTGAYNDGCYTLTTSNGVKKGCTLSYSWCEGLRQQQKPGEEYICCKGELCNGARTINTTSWTQVLLTLAVIMMINKLML